MSKQEMLYKTFVSILIYNKAGSQEDKEKRLFNFCLHAENYYDAFCDSIYLLMTKNGVNSVYIDEFGCTRFCFSNDSAVGYKLLGIEDVETPSDDVIKYIDLALTRLLKVLDSFNQLCGTNTLVLCS